MRSTKKIILSEKDKSWLVKHFKHTKNDEIMEHLGLTYSALHRFARQLGLKKTKQFMRKTQTAASEAAKASHLRNGTYPPKGYLIPNAPRFQPGVSNKQRLSAKKYAECQEKRRLTWLANRKKDHARFVFGFEQKTKHRFVQQSRSKICYRHNMKKHGYVVDIEHNIFYYPNEEMRRHRAEANGAKYGITFKLL